MIELPRWAVPVDASPALLDFGGVLRPVLGGPIQKIDRAGSRYRVSLAFPPAEGEAEGRILIARMIRAKREGLRVPYPLPRAQPVAGAPVVDGAGQSGSRLLVRGIQPRQSILEGWWMTVYRADGQGYLYNVGAVIADADGRAAIPIAPMLRWPHANGDRVELVEPTIEGVVDGGEWGWSVDVENLVGIEATIEEAA